MQLTPPQLDLWLVGQLATLLGRSPVVDSWIQCVGRGGGIWYAAAFFALWVQSAAHDQLSSRRRLLTIVLGSLIAASLTILLESAISWPPPSVHPALAALYPEEFPINLDPTSFPSHSTAVYAALAAGIYSLRRTIGVLAWSGVATVVALPRVYFGGHYFTDIGAGVIIGIGSFFTASILEASVGGWCESPFEYQWDHWQRTLAEGTLFLWILQVATRFQHFAWILRIIAESWT